MPATAERPRQCAGAAGERPEEASARTPRFHLPALDGARGVAVLFVLLDHSHDAGLLIHPSLNFNRAGLIGVLLFFALSSFLLSYMLFSQEDKALERAGTWANYFVRRGLRIFPLFAITLIAWAVFRGDFVAADIVNHLLLRDGQRHFWTIPVEVKYYFLLPAVVCLVAVCWRRNRTLAIVLGLLLSAFLRFGLKPLERAFSLSNDIWLEDYLKVFLLGTVLGFIHARPGSLGPVLVRWRAAAECLAWISLGVAMLYMPQIYHAVFQSDADERVPKTVQVLSFVWPLFLFGALHGRGGMAWLLSFAPLRWMGLVSYSAYLWHPFLTQTLKGVPWPTPLRLAAFIALLCVVSGVSYYVIERPLSKLRLRWSRSAKTA